jgi:uncharacterized membrane protein YdjX (TVP38/TMEM64 family)
MDRSITREKNNRPTRIFIVTLLILMVLLFFVSREMDQVTSFIRNSGLVGVAISIGLYGLLGASVIPSEPLTILISTIYGPFTATIVAGLGNTCAALIEYYLGAHLGGMANFAEKKGKLPFGLGKLPITSPVFLMVGRMMPGYGPKLVSLAGGMYRVPLWRYIWTTAIPTFIGAAIFAYGGFGVFTWIKTIRP